TNDSGSPLALPRPTALGDYNHSGSVDAADYVVWRTGLGTVFASGDYDVWRSHFGTTISAGQAASFVAASVPEPTTATLILFGALGCRCCRSRYASTKQLRS